MPERLLHYIWQYKLFAAYRQRTTRNDDIEIIDVGKLNTDAGPDFFNAKIKINGQLWAGNIEIHVNASDWYQHHHDKDAAYDNIILHVVQKADCEVFNSKGKAVLQCELRFSDTVITRYAQWLTTQKFIPCQNQIAQVPDIYINDWKEALLIDRLNTKANTILELLKINNNSWEDTFYITLAHYFGFHTNGMPFELLAKQTPLSVLGKHRDNLFQLEAILFGQAGMLADNTDQDDDYYKALQKEYAFLRTKFSLTPIDGTLWKRLRMRPDNFPTVRIAEFAALIHQNDQLFATLIEAQNVKQIAAILDIKTSEYWDNHYLFNSASITRPKHLGKQAVNTLIINIIVPYLYTYGAQRNLPHMQQRAETLLDLLPPEKNHITDQWTAIGMRIENAAESQAMIQLHQLYCTDRKCLYCRIANQILKSEITGQ